MEVIDFALSLVAEMFSLPSVDLTGKCVNICHNFSGLLVGSLILLKYEYKNGTESYCYAPMTFTFRRPQRRKLRPWLEVSSTPAPLCWGPRGRYFRTLAELRNGITSAGFL